MALPSQTERSSEFNRSVMANPGGGMRPSRAQKIVLTAAVLLLLAGGIYAATQMLPSRKPVQREGAPRVVKNDPTPVVPASDAPAKQATAPPTQSAFPQQQTAPTAPQPVTITQGAGNPVQSAPQSVAQQAEQVPVTTPVAGGPAGGAIDVPDHRVLTLIAAGDKALTGNRLAEARAAYSAALLHKDCAVSEKAGLRTKLQKINDDVLFSPRIDEGDPLVESYRVQPGDSLQRIAKRRELAVDWQLIQRVNRISDPQRIRVGQTLKLVKGPFHAVVNKGEYRVDLYAGAPAEPGSWVFIRSFPCGLGESNSTPTGEYIVKRNSKLINPHWVNPRTGDSFSADDPNNPIGEHWIGWQGVGESAKNQGYGFHGTIDPGSIGRQKSMGCVRLGAEDVGFLYELLVEDVSVVRVLP